MVRLFIGLGVVALGFTIYCVVECIQTPRRDIRVMSKLVWILLILLLPLIGAGLWLGLGKAKHNVQEQRRKGPRAPDDDPEFLRNIDLQRRQAARREQERQRREELTDGTAASEGNADANTVNPSDKPSTEANAEDATSAQSTENDGESTGHRTESSDTSADAEKTHGTDPDNRRREQQNRESDSGEEKGR